MAEANPSIQQTTTTAHTRNECNRVGRRKLSSASMCVRTSCGRGRLSVISAYGYARHERTSDPHKRVLRFSLSGASNTPDINDRRRIDLRDRR
jgi:hypothetical protein